MGGSELDFLPTETDASEDYISCKGIALEGLDTYLLEKVGGIVKTSTPNYSLKYVHVANNLSYVEVFNGFTQTTPNRIARGDFTYTSNNLTTEVWVIYSTANGTTVLRTVTITHTYTANNVQTTTVSEA